ncbi:MAG: hypothetical protein R3D90_01065 [Paracoccaceae bacterium]
MADANVAQAATDGPAPALAPLAAQPAAPELARTAAISTALDLLQERSPAIHDRIVALVDAGEVPDTALLREVVAVLGGAVPPDGAEGEAVTLPGLGPVGTMAELTLGLGPAVQARRLAASAATAAGDDAAAVALPTTESAPVVAAAGIAADAVTGETGMGETANGAAPSGLSPDGSPAPLPPPGSEAVLLALDRLQETRPDLHQRLVADIAEGRPADPAVLREVITLMGGRPAEGSEREGADGTPAIVVADLGLAGSIDQLNQTISALVAAQAAPAPAAPNAADPGIPDTVLRIADAAPGLAVPAADGSEGTTTIRSPSSDEQPITLPLFALPQGEMVTMQPMIDAANVLIAKDATGDAGAGSLSPNLVMLVAMQNEQLQFGKTLMRLPQPLTALPYSVDQPVSCWTGARLTPGMLPTALLLLDALSVSSDSDVSGLTPDVREVVMETALSPDRVKACLRQTGTTFGAMVGGSSTFLTETARNPDFVEFLFRNVPVAQLPLAGANLAGDRYVELTDGRKLGEGAAPDITSRIMSIGDLGILLRTAEGTRIQLYGSTLGWRVADTCGPNECGMN